MSPNLNQVIQFLLGNGELDGVYFGEKPEGVNSNFWWRKHLRDAYTGGQHVHHPELVRIKNEVALYYGMKPDDLVGARRTLGVIHARHMAVFMCRALTSFSTHEIADVFNKKDHSTIVYATEKMKFKINNQWRTRRQFEELKQRLETKHDQIEEQRTVNA